MISLFLCFFAALALLLAACGSPNSTSVPLAATSTPMVKMTVAPTGTAAPNSGTATPVLPLEAIRMLDKQNGWALTASSILKTVDGGIHWKDVSPAHAGLNQFAKGTFRNDHDAWIAIPPAQQQPGPGITILRTDNGGQSWKRSKINDPLVSVVDAPHFVNGQQGWLEASNTLGAGHTDVDIWHSTDGGQHWIKLASNTDASGFAMGYVTGLSFRDEYTGIATGNLSATGDNTIPSISITQNGGKAWQTMALPHMQGGDAVSLNISQPPVFFGSMVFLPVIVSTQNGELLILYRSQDSGMHWVQTTPVPIAAENTYVMDIYHAWATDTQNGKFYRTLDGGINWTATSDAAYNLKALSFIDADSGWGIANQTLMHTTNGGQEWQQIHYTIH